MSSSSNEKGDASGQTHRRKSSPPKTTSDKYGDGAEKSSANDVTRANGSAHTPGLKAANGQTHANGASRPTDSKPHASENDKSNDGADALAGAMAVLLQSPEHWPIVAIRKGDEKILAPDFSEAEAAEAHAWCKAAVADGFDLYFAINPLKEPLGRKASKNDVSESRLVYVDCDPPKSLTGAALKKWRAEKLEELRTGGRLGKPATIVIDSGSGLWGLWQLREAIPLDGPRGENTRLVESHARALRDIFHGDAKCANVDRICRLPGYRNSKTGRVARIVVWNAPSVYELSDFPREVRTSAEGATTLAYAQFIDDDEAHATFTKYLAKQPPAIEGDGGRALTMKILQRGLDFGLRLSTAAQLMTESEWNAKCDPPWAYTDDDNSATLEIEWEFRDLENSRGEPIGCAHPAITREKRKKEARARAARYLENVVSAFDHEKNNDRTDSSEQREETDKGDANNRVRSLSEVLNDSSATLPDAMRALNTLYAFALEGGKATVLRENISPDSGHRFYERMTIADFKAAYQNRKFSVPDGKGGSAMVKLGDQWLSWLYRRQYLGGVTFNPGGSNRSDVLNLWRGFAVRPAKGSWRKTLRHIRKVLCRSDKASFKYFIRWMAFAVQHPETRGHVALVMRGDEGVGKGIIANALRKIFGQHGLHIGDAGHLVGRFNDHLQCCVLLFADEAFFAGDRAHIAILKKLVTEDSLEIEGKFRAVIESKNYLHLIMASNDDWVVPASLEARRFAVFDVSDERRGDHAYFQEIADELDNGGLAAMLHDLLKVDLSKFNIRNFPKTEGLQNQQLQSLSAQHKWLLDVLQRGYVWQSQHHLPELVEWRDDLAKDLWFESYLRFAKERGERRPLDRIAFGKFMNAMRAASGKSGSAIIGETKSSPGRLVINQRKLTPVYRYGDSLADARRWFEEATGLRIAWDELSED